MLPLPNHLISVPSPISGRSINADELQPHIFGKAIREITGERPVWPDRFGHHLTPPPEGLAR